MSAIADLTIAEAGAALRSRSISSVELTQAALDRVDRLDPTLQAFIAVTRDRAMEEARQADRELAGGTDRGALHGIPYGLKDIYDVAGVATTCHSRVCLDNIAAADCAVQERLRAAGAVLIGKQATAEFAMGGPGPELPFPMPRNPWNAEYLTGGSSSGSAAAVASGMTRLSMGSDTGGSIRVPASYCGIVGVRATSGLVSRRGVYPLAYSLDQCGPMARTVNDAALALNAVAGFDPLDPASAERPRENYAALVGAPVKGRRVAYAREMMLEVEGLSPDLLHAMDRAAETLRQLGAIVEEVKLPRLELAGAVCIVIMIAEGYAIHETMLKERPLDYGRVFYQRVLPGMGLTASDLTQAFRLRRELALTLEREIFSRHDAILTCSAATAAPKFDQFSLDVPLSFPPASPTFLASATGHPALAVPVGMTGEGMPLGMQLIGRYFDEARLFSIAAAFESAAGALTGQPRHAA